MKILFVSSCFPSDNAPQYCVFLEQQARALQSLGHQVDILIIHTSKGVKKDRIYFLQKRNDLNIYDWLTAESKVKSHLQIPISTKCIQKFFNEQGYSAVSLHFGGFRHFYPIVQACHALNIMVVGHYHGLNVWYDYYETIKQKVVRLYSNCFTKFILHQYDHIVGVSELTCKIVKKHYRKSNISTVYNGVDSSLFCENKGRQNEKFTILCVANLIPIKGQRFLIDAVAKCIQKGYSIELRLGGEGGDRSSLERKCEELGIVNHVVFLGRMPYAQVAVEMQSADMFIMPSYFEALGCVYLEAMACGTLTCGCYNNGAAEIITHNKNGLLVKEKNVASIEESIEFAINNSEKCHLLAKEGKLTALHFSWKNSAEQLEKVYLSGIQKKAN